MFKAIISVTNAKTGKLCYSQSPRVFASESELEQYKKRFAYGTIEVTHEVVGEATVEELFTQLVNEHDLTFNYSDDHTAWKRGSAELNRIKGLIPTVGEERAKLIWNAMVDKCITEQDRKGFHWS